jgi:O-antigen/teichoic acid export membrane protein
VSRRLSLAFGMCDAGLSSLATFAVGIYASHTLPLPVLGGYAIVFSAFVLSAIVPTQLVFIPAETVAVSHPLPARLALLRDTLRLGLPVAALAAAFVALAALAVPSAVPPGVVLALTVTAVASAFLSPVQDHVRRMLHLGDGSWGAAAVSAVHLVVVVGTVAVPHSEAVRPWIPFGALALGNAASLLVGIAMARARRPVPIGRIVARDLLQSGGWLLVVGTVAPATAFLVASVVAHIAGSAALGYAEAARVIGQPMLVLATGLAAVLGPHVTEAAQAGEAALARRTSREFALLMLAAGAPYLALVGHAWRGNPLAALVPNAYAIGGLVIVSVLANVANGMNYLQRSELLGAGKAPALARIEVAANAVRIVIGSAAALLHAFAIPLGLVFLGITRWVAYSRVLRGHYAKRSVEPRPRAVEAA